MKSILSILKPTSSFESVAILGDIHSNLDALNAVIHDAETQGIQQFVCVGDVVGYGAEPAGCIRRLQNINAPTVKGNHDQYCAEGAIPAGVNDLARTSMLWTAKQISPEELLWLKNLPMQLQHNEVLLTHSSFETDRHWPYVFDESDAAPSLTVQPAPLAFYGHTHRPIVFIQAPDGKTTRRELSTYRLPKKNKVFINPGSVGQPRDGDSRAAYAILDPAKSTVTLRRVDYDIEAAASKIRAAGLPDRNADRLFLGR